MALLAAILAFAAQSLDVDIASELNRINICALHDDYKSYFIDQAIIYLDEAIRECGDDPVPLFLLQALVLVTHWLLIRNVRGRAWRYLGTCVSVAYELNLHLVDSDDEAGDGGPDISRWCADEERRRAWWAVWEMDVFASIVRRCPTIIDWSQMKTCLPAQDDQWFRGEPQRSCVLYPSAIDRVRALESSGNKSPVAWYIVVNSLVKEARDISSPPEVLREASSRAGWKLSLHGGSRGIRHRSPDEIQRAEAFQKLSMLSNALKCFTMGLPKFLRYHDQRLSFDGSVPSPCEQMSLRHFHSALYSIHMMTQLAKFMIYKYYIFHGNTNSPVVGQKSLLTLLDPENDHTNQYFQAANNVTILIQRSSEDHFQFVNPCFANTVWLAAAVQLLRREVTSASGADRDQINSEFELVRFSYDRFVKNWGISHVLDANLITLEQQLLSFRRLCRPSIWENAGGQKINQGRSPFSSQYIPDRSTNNGKMKALLYKLKYLLENCYSPPR
jgi:hypothetical protein